MDLSDSTVAVGDIVGATVEEHVMMFRESL
jgi:hypothetical protein